MAKALIISGFFLFCAAIGNLVKWIIWSSSAEKATSYVLEFDSYIERKEKKKIFYICTYNTALSDSRGVREGKMKKEFDNLEQARALAGTEIQGYSRKNGKFLSDSEYETLRKTWRSQLLISVISFAIGVLIIVIFESVT